MVTLILFVLIFGVVVISHEFDISAGEGQWNSCDRIFRGYGPESVFLSKGDTKYSLKLSSHRAPRLYV